MSYYPFRSLFTGHEQNEKEFTVSISDQAITFLQTLPPSLGKKENYSFVFNTGQLDIAFQNEPQNTISATIPITDSITVYDSEKTADLRQPTKSCDASRQGRVSESWQDQNGGYKRIESAEASACLDIGLTDLSQRYGYVVLVKSRHISGRRLFISITNEETKRTFLESYVTDKESGGDFINSFFVIPPMDEFGMGYWMTLDNLSVNNDPTINDIASVRVYMIPYEEMVHMSSRGVPSNVEGRRGDLYNEEIASPSARNDIGIDSGSEAGMTIMNVYHPNPAYYKVNFQLPIFNFQSNSNDQNSNDKNTNTLILSQSFDKGWHAYEVGNFQFSIFNFQLGTLLSETFPFLFGKELKEHVLVNNWENAWRIAPLPADQAKQEPSTNSSEKANAELRRGWEDQTIVLFFLPQLLQYLGFALLPIPFLILLLKK
jgi:hypothetical protein